MERSIPSLDRVRLEETLIVFLAHIIPACAQIDYRLVGTAAALLHGVPLAAADIDILVKERRGVDAFGSALSPFRCLQAPIWLACSQQYYGSYEVNGVEVQISTVETESDSDTRECFGLGPWEHFTIVPCGRYAMPTVALELRLITELARNRPDRYQPLIQFMQIHGCDLDFIQRGIEAAGLPEATQGGILGQLRCSMSPPITGISLLARGLER